jgi:hypothetical protein
MRFLDRQIVESAGAVSAESNRLTAARAGLRNSRDPLHDLLIKLVWGSSALADAPILNMSSRSE